MLLLNLLVWFGGCILCAWPHVKCICNGAIVVFMFSVGVCPGILTGDGKSEEICISCLVSERWMCRMKDTYD